MSEQRVDLKEEERLSPSTIEPFGTQVIRPKPVSEIAPKLGERMVRLRVPHKIMLTLNPAEPLKQELGGDRVEMMQGEYDVPESLADHWYVKAAGAVIVRRSDLPGFTVSNTGAPSVDDEIAAAEAHLAELRRRAGGRDAA